jgi:hypothetical protein
MRKAATLAGGGLNLELLLFDLIDPIARLGLGGLDLEAVLLGGGREEAPDAVRLSQGPGILLSTCGGTYAGSVVASLTAKRTAARP